MNLICKNGGNGVSETYARLVFSLCYSQLLDRMQGFNWRMYKQKEEERLLLSFMEEKGTCWKLFC